MWKTIFPVFFLPVLLFGDISWQEKVEGGFSAQVTIPTSSLTIEENLHIDVILSYPDTHDVDLEKLRVNLLKYAGLSEPPFALTSENIDTPAEGKMKITFILEPQLAGLQFVSLYDITFTPKDPDQHQPVEIISDIFKVEITLPPIEEGFHGLASPLLSLTKKFPIAMGPKNRKQLFENTERNIKERWRNILIFRWKTFPWGELAGVCLIAILLLIVRMQPKKGPNLEKERLKRALTAKNKALLSLESLEEQHLIQEKKFEIFYVQLTNTLRKYIEEKFQLKASTQTTPEFLHQMASHPGFDREIQSILTDFLISADRVKFAEHQPAPEECRDAYAIAKQFIEI